MTLVPKQAPGSHVTPNKWDSGINVDQETSCWVECYFPVKIYSKIRLGRTEIQLAFSTPSSTLQSGEGACTAWGIGAYQAGKGAGRCPERCEQRHRLPSSDRKKGKGVGVGPAVIQRQGWEYL